MAFYTRFIKALSKQTKDKQRFERLLGLSFMVVFLLSVVGGFEDLVAQNADSASSGSSATSGTNAVASQFQSSVANSLNSEGFDANALALNGLILNATNTTSTQTSTGTNAAPTIASVASGTDNALQNYGFDSSTLNAVGLSFNVNKASSVPEISGYESIAANIAQTMSDSSAKYQLAPVAIAESPPTNVFGTAVLQMNVDSHYVFGDNDLSLIREYLGYDASEVSSQCQLRLGAMTSATGSTDMANVYAGQTGSILYTGTLNGVQLLPAAVCTIPSTLPQTGASLMQVTIGSQKYYAVQLANWETCKVNIAQQNLGSVLWHAGSFGTDTYSSVSDNFSSYTVNGANVSISALNGIPSFTYNGKTYYVDSVGNYNGHQAFTINGMMYYINNGGVYTADGKASTNFISVLSASSGSALDEGTVATATNPFSSFQTYHPAKYEFSYMTLNVTYAGDNAGQNGTGMNCTYAYASYNGQPVDSTNGDETPPSWADFSYIKDGSGDTCFARTGTKVCPVPPS